jgi:ATP-dependent RNA helicase DDX54/DBP10
MRSTKMTWDKKKKKFIQGDGIGADNVKMVRTENGSLLPATFRSGRFDEWKSKSRVALPQIGEAENSSTGTRKHAKPGVRRFKHNRIVAPKPLDKLSNDYERKVRQQKKEEANGPSSSSAKQSSLARGKKVSMRRGGKTFAHVKTELKTSEQIRKNRGMLEKRRAKNARPSRHGGKKGRR